ncbi:MAG: metal-dependent transcriptional regulator [Clostridia bacterium]|nr:metal-dependent transcriptional regulator [Clostridia bacterium]
MLTNSLEEYLKTIYILKNSEGQVRVTDISKKLNCSKPSVNRALKCLKDEGLILYEAYGNIEITEDGEKLAKSAVKREDILKLFLIQIIDVDNQTAEKEAIAMKHAISEETVSKLENYIIKVLGLDDLKCNFDLGNNQCQNCIRVKNKNATS